MADLAGHLEEFVVFEHTLGSVALAHLRAACMTVQVLAALLV
jgi:hypothetical protein